MYNGCRTFSGHPPCWSRSLSPPHGWPESPLRHEGIPGVTPAGRQDGSMWGRDATGPESPLHPAGRGHRRPSPMRQPPLPNRPINECGTGAFYSSRERVSCLSPLVFLPSFSPCSELIAALFPLFIGTWRRRQPGVA
jgi:hypothetical protein